MADLVLVVHKQIRAPRERVFDAWLSAEQLRQWWTPPAATCIGVELDPTVGGHYTIGNRIDDGTEIWIRGRFEVVDRPERLVFSWSLSDDAPNERVSVRFIPQDGGTRVTLTHERITDPAARASHEAGWQGCLAGLAAHTA